MCKLLRFVAVVLFLPTLAVIALAMDAQAAQKARETYRISLAAVGGGPVRAALPVGTTETLTVRSTPDLTPENQARLAWHFRNAALQSERFAKKHGSSLARTTLPTRVEIFSSPKELAAMSYMPESEYGCTVVARINLSRGVVMLGRKTPEDLYVELGKWYLYPEDYRWGQNRGQDMAMLKRAEAFASFCLDQKNWVEADGSTKGIW
jgi:hypothetical protein